LLIDSEATTEPAINIDIVDGDAHIRLVGDSGNASPTEGDLWRESDGLKYYDGTTEHNLLSASTDLTLTENVDGFEISGGSSSERTLTVSGADVSFTGSGSNTFTFPSSSQTLVGTTAEQTLTNKTLAAYKLDATPDTDHTANGPTTDTLNAGTTVAIGEVVYLASDGEWALTDADATASAEALLGIALEAGTDGNSMEVALPGSFVRDDSWNWTVGATLYLSTTAGDLTETAPSATDDVVRVVGYAVSADVVYFQPQQGVIHA